MSVSAVVTRGFGIFGSVPNVVTAGFSIGDASIISQADVNKIWAYKPDNVYTASEMMNLFAAVLGGLVSQVGNQTPTFRNLSDTKDVIKMQTDDVGNRVKRITIDLT